MRRTVLSLLLLLLIGCDSKESPVGPKPSEGTPQPQLAVTLFDRTTEGGNPRFQWLAPIAKGAGLDELVDPGLLPLLRVSVCRVSGADCTPVGSFDGTGAASERLRVADDLSHFLAVWSTKDVPDSDYRIGVYVLDTQLGYAVVSVGKKGKGNSDVVDFNVGSSVPIKFWVGTGMLDQAEIGPAGGLVVSSEARAIIVIPPGAVSALVSVEMTMTESPVMESPLGPGVRITFPNAAAENWTAGANLTLTGAITEVPDPTRKPKLKALFYGLTEPWYGMLSLAPEGDRYQHEIPSEDIAKLIMFADGGDVSLSIFPDQSGIEVASPSPGPQRVIVNPWDQPRAKCEVNAPSANLDRISPTPHRGSTALVFVHGWDKEIGDCDEWYYAQSPLGGFTFRWGWRYWKVALDALDELTDDYPTWVFNYSSHVPFAATGADLAEAVELLLSSDTDLNGIIFIGHSMGGLVARVAANIIETQADPLVPGVRGVITLGTPHLGTPLVTSSLANFRYDGVGSEGGRSMIPCDHPEAANPCPLEQIGALAAPIIAYGGLSWQGKWVPESPQTKSTFWNGNSYRKALSAFVMCSVATSAANTSPPECTSDGAVPLASAIPTRFGIEMPGEWEYRGGELGDGGRFFYDHGEIYKGWREEGNVNDLLFTLIKEDVDKLAAPLPPAGFVATQLSAKYYQTCGLTTEGAAFCWGLNWAGQLGDGTTSNRSMPVSVLGGRVFTSLTAGAGHTCGVTSGGETYCWGWNNGGQLGDGWGNLFSYEPVSVIGGLVFTSLTAGSQHTCGLTTGGLAYCWGQNGKGELGEGTTTNRRSPVAVAGGLTFTSLTAGAQHTCGLTTEGAAYCWGYNGQGQLGVEQLNHGTETEPMAVAGGLVFTDLTAGEAHTCGLTTGGAAFCWGYNGQQQLGDSTRITRYTPVAVKGGLMFDSLAAGGYHTCGLTTGGAAFCWGDGNNGQLGWHAPGELIQVE